MSDDELKAIREWLAAADADTINRKQLNPWPWRYAHDMRKVLSEIDRLKRGNFTEEEFQALCHRFTEDDACRFAKGCIDYNKRLFGDHSKLGDRSNLGEDANAGRPDPQSAETD